MNGLDDKTIKELNNEFDFLNKEISSFMINSYRREDLDETDRRKYYTQFISGNSDLSEKFFKHLPTKQLHLITLGISSGLKLLPLFLLTYPLFSQIKLDGLIYILEFKNVLNLIIEQMIFMNDDEFLEIVNELKRGKGCAEIIYNFRDRDAYVDVFNMTNELDDEFFSNLLDHMDVNQSIGFYAPEPLTTKPKKGTAIAFDLEKLKARNKKNQE